MRENMDMDTADVDQNLLQQFSCMGTTDREVLIAELQKLVGNQLNPAGCAFFLDMNNWNLQAAVCSYYDFESPTTRLPCMAFVADITVGEGESVCPSTKFIKTWRLKNSGEEAWPAGCRLRFIQGDHFGHRDDILVEHTLPSTETTDISVEMISPDKPGIFQGQWRMSTPNGYYFGEIIWVILTVSEVGLLGLTQQMSSLHELGSPPRNAVPMQVNPFSSGQQCLGEVMVTHAPPISTPSQLFSNSPKQLSEHSDGGSIADKECNQNSINGPVVMTTISPTTASLQSNDCDKQVLMSTSRQPHDNMDDMMS